MGLKISAEQPPNWEKLQEVFGFHSWDNGPIVTYGDTAYFHRGGLPPDLIEHESIHVKRQAEYGIEAWWDRYYTDAQFRLEEEVLAYRAQRAYIEQYVSNRSKAKAKIDFIHTSMAGMYGDMCTLERARELV